MGKTKAVISDRHIARSALILGGEPVIAGTRTPIRAIVELWRMGTPPKQICVSLPHVTRGQVFAALSYYSDHQDEIEVYIKRNRIPDDQIDPLVKQL